MKSEQLFMAFADRWEPAPAWRAQNRIQGGCGGKRLKEQRAALIRYTEQPIRQGRIDNPWEGVAASVVLGETSEAVALLKRANEGSRGTGGGQEKSGSASAPGMESHCGCRGIDSGPDLG